MLTLNAEERGELIGALVTNCAGWDEDDIDLLVNMSDEKIFNHAEICAEIIGNVDEEDESSGMSDSLDPSSAEELQDEAEDDGWEDETISKTTPPTSGAPAETPAPDEPKRCYDEDGNEIDCPENSSQAEGENVTKNERAYLNRLPRRVRDVVVNALEFEDNRKAQLVDQITANSHNRFSGDFLMRQSVNNLEAIAALASPNGAVQPIYAAGAGGPVINQGEVDRDDVLLVPTLEFSQDN